MSFVALAECLVSQGYCLEMGGIHAPGIHYNIRGSGRLIIKGCAPVELKPHTLVIVPPNAPFRIEAEGFHRGLQNLRTVDGLLVAVSKDSVKHIVAGEGEPEVILICGYFDACYGSAVDLFHTLTTPIVEQFTEADRLDETLKSAIAELVTQEVGSGAMSSALLKLVIVHILRRSLHSNNTWVERFSPPPGSPDRPGFRRNGEQPRRPAYGQFIGANRLPGSIGLHGTIHGYRRPAADECTARPENASGRRAAPDRAGAHRASRSQYRV